MDPPDGLGEQNGNVDRLDFVTLEFLQIVRNCVGDDNFVDGRIFDQTGSFFAQDAMGSQGIDLVCSTFLIDKKSFTF